VNLFMPSFPWKKATPPLIGLDMDTDTIRMVRIEKKGQQFVIAQADSEPIAPQTDADDDPVSNALRTLIQRMGLRTGKKGMAVAMALPDSEVITKTMTIPAGLSAQAIEEQIRFEGKKYIPYSMEQVSFDFSPLGQTMIDGEAPTQKQQSILLVACKQDDVEDRMAILETVGLTPKILEARKFSLWNLWCYLHPQESAEKAVALVEIGKETSYLHVFQHNIPLYSREHHFGTIRLSDRLVRDYDIDFAQAQRIQQGKEAPPTGFAEKTLQPFLASLGSEIQHALDFFLASQPDVQIGKIGLFGVCSRLQDIVGSFPSGIPVEIPDPFGSLRLGDDISTAFNQDQSSAFAVACGLALRRFF